MAESRTGRLGRGDCSDWSAQAFAEILVCLDAHYPMSDGYGEAHRNRERHEPWYRSQREHIVVWLREIDGPGAYDRKTRGLGAKHFYQHFQCAQGLLWVAEALGEDPLVVQRAADAAGGVGRPATRCAAIRKVIPWSRIVELTVLLEGTRSIERSSRIVRRMDASKRRRAGGRAALPTPGHPSPTTTPRRP